jgi:hypothetical protein
MVGASDTVRFQQGHREINLFRSISSELIPRDCSNYFHFIKSPANGFGRITIVILVSAIARVSSVSVNNPRETPFSSAAMFTADDGVTFIRYTESAVLGLMAYLFLTDTTVGRNAIARFAFALNET